MSLPRFFPAEVFQQHDAKFPAVFLPTLHDERGNIVTLHAGEMNLSEHLPDCPHTCSHCTVRQPALTGVNELLWFGI